MAKRTYRPTPQQLDAVWECLEREIDWSQLREIPDSSAMAWRYVAVLVRRALSTIGVAEPARVADIMPDDPPGPRSAALRRLFAHLFEHMEARDPTVTVTDVGRAVSRADPRGFNAALRELHAVVVTTLLADLPRRRATW